VYVVPAQCFPKSLNIPTSQRFDPSATAGIKFVIATLPDPLHTHFSLAFDRMAEALQQGVQDGGYFYDSSWLPWESEEQNLNNLSDQDSANQRHEAQENEPGILLFRGQTPTGGKADSPFHGGAVVFVVGEDPTSGIHRRQFVNAIKWIWALRGSKQENPVTLGILGPSFSGSMPSLLQLLSSKDTLEENQASPSIHEYLYHLKGGLPAFSGTVEGRTSVSWLKRQLNDPLQPQLPRLEFRSFQHDDGTTLDRFCRYLSNTQPHFKLAIVSEDETAYGGDRSVVPDEAAKNRDKSKKDKDKSNCIDNNTVISLYYPRDISELRSAYQAQSIFSTQSGGNQETAKKGLSTNLSEAGGKMHDSIRLYSDNQTPLSQESELMGIVSTLRSHGSEYVVLRSSNPLDQLFLSQYLRRSYPEARIVILGADALIRRERDISLRGVMTLSTYPLLAWENDWIHPELSAKHDHRTFPEDEHEGFYVATRFLFHRLQDLHEFAADAQEKPGEPDLSSTFAPPVPLSNSPADRSPAAQLDYSPPYWNLTTDTECSVASNPGCSNHQPATWLSVLGRGNYLPVAVLNDETLLDHSEPAAKTLNPQSKPALRIPLLTRFALIAAFAWACFHLYCCALGSYTGQPRFRSYFAGESTWRHRFFILMQSLSIYLASLFLTWGCGAFASEGGPFLSSSVTRGLLLVVWIVTLLSVALNHRVTFTDKNRVTLLARSIVEFVILSIGTTWCFYSYMEGSLNAANRVPTYWRSMNLMSLVSPVVPLVICAAGTYLWAWYSLYSLALCCDDRPLLPTTKDLSLGELGQLRMFACEDAQFPAEKAATPLSPHSIVVMASAITVTVLIGLLTTSAWPPVRSLGRQEYVKIVISWALILTSIMLAQAWQLWRTWSRLKQLLTFLDRTSLRRTLGSLKGLSWRNIWDMSGNVLSSRYELLSRELESLRHLIASITEYDSKMARIGARPTDPIVFKTRMARIGGRSTDPIVLEKLELARDAGKDFGTWFIEHYQNSDMTTEREGQGKLQEFQKSAASAAGTLLTKLLYPAWQKETKSLLLELHNNEAASEDKAGDKSSHLSIDGLPQHIQNAEEFVCLPYLGFVQNSLGRIRTIVMSLIWLFLTLSMSLALYPFDPRPLLSETIGCVFAILGAVTIWIYADMHRDTTLSHLTNTKPGELGVEFWLKLLGFGAGPLLGVLTVIFPELADVVVSWLQPGIQSLR
jgi:hypothetical protein